MNTHSILRDTQLVAMVLADARPEITFCIQLTVGGRYEIRQGDRSLGTCQNEMMAIWSAVSLAQDIARTGRKVRVIRIGKAGNEVEEYVAG